MLDLAVRFAKWVFYRHFRVSRPLYVLLGAVGLALLILGGFDSATALAGATCVLVAIQGLARWTLISHPRPVLAVAVFASADRRRAEDVQRTIMSTMQDHLASRLPFTIIGIPQVIGASEARLASQIRRRTHAMYLVFGDIRLVDNRIAIFPRLMQPSRGDIKHVDEFTNETIRQRTIWQVALSRLSGGVADMELEYPFEFASELVVMIESLEGKALLLFGAPDAARTALTQALTRVRDSRSHAIDDIRIELAKALDALQKRERAIALLRRRAKERDASPDLLRNLARLVVARRDGVLPLAYTSETSRRYDEAIGWLREAANDRSDPERDMSLYNLRQLLHNANAQGEAVTIVEELLVSKTSHYRHAWYLLRERGAIEWQQAIDYRAQDLDEEAVLAFARAAAFYTRAIVRRPKLLFARGSRYRAPRIQRVPIPPKMYGNAADAHREAGHSLRTRFLMWREKRSRQRVLKLGGHALERSDFDAALGHFLWAIVGRGDDWDLHANLGCALAHMGMQRQDEAGGHAGDAREHVEPGQEHLGKALAIDPIHAQESLKAMTGIDIGHLVTSQDSE